MLFLSPSIVNSESVIFLSSFAYCSSTSLIASTKRFLLFGRTLKLGDKYLYSPSIFSSTK